MKKPSLFYRLPSTVKKVFTEHILFKVLLKVLKQFPLFTRNVFYISFQCSRENLLLEIWMCVKKAALVAMTSMPVLGRACPSRGQCSSSASQTLGHRAASLEGWTQPLITSHFKTVI